MSEETNITTPDLGSNPYNPRRGTGVANEYYAKWLRDHDTLVQVVLDRHQKFIDLVNAEPETDDQLYPIVQEDPRL